MISTKICPILLYKDLEAHMADYSLNGLDITAEEFISAFAEPHEIVYIRVFSDRPKEDSIFTGANMSRNRHNSHNSQNVCNSIVRRIVVCSSLSITAVITTKTSPA
jgi:hypothetical protein